MLTLLGSFLRKNQRALKLNSLTLLDTLVNNYSVFIDSQLLKGAIYEIPPLLCEADLHVAQLSLVLLTSTAKFQSQALVGAHTAFLPEVMTLVRSPLLQGTALNCTLNLFQVLVQAQLPGLGYRQLLEMLMYPALHQQTNNQLHKQVRSISANRKELEVLRVFISLSHSVGLSFIGKMRGCINASRTT